MQWHFYHLQDEYCIIMLAFYYVINYTATYVLLLPRMHNNMQSFFVDYSC